MTKRYFVDIINALREANDLQDKIAELMKSARDNIQNDFMNAAGLMICHEDIVVLLLAEIMEDEYETISWWIYETDYGRKEAKIYDKEGENVVVTLDTPEKLYEYLMEIKENGAY